MTPPRLHVLTATKSAKAVVLRRGPTGRVASIGWDRATGAIEVGQWLAGRIYEHRSDISPDGQHMIYFAGKGGMRWWTAISRAPWLHALVLLPQNSTWGGGGAFTPDGEVWLNGHGMVPELAVGTAKSAGFGVRQAANLRAYPHSTDGFHMGDTYVARMAERGWQHVFGTGFDAVLTREIADGWQLELRFAVMQANRSAITNRYALLHPASGLRLPQPDWEWAEPWQGQVQVAAKGALVQARLNGNGAMADIKHIHDFSAMQPGWVRAPYDDRPAGEQP